MDWNGDLPSILHILMVLSCDTDTKFVFDFFVNATEDTGSVCPFPSPTQLEEKEKENVRKTKGKRLGEQGKRARRQDKTKQNKTKQNKTKQNKTKQNKTKQNKTKQNKTKQNKKEKRKKRKKKKEKQEKKRRKAVTSLLLFPTIEHCDLCFRRGSTSHHERHQWRGPHLCGLSIGKWRGWRGRTRPGRNCWWPPPLGCTPYLRTSRPTLNPKILQTASSCPPVQYR